MVIIELDKSPQRVYQQWDDFLFTRSHMKPRAGMYQTVWLYRWVFIAHMFQVSHKQWEVAILILINTSASIKFRIVEMDNWL